MPFQVVDSSEAIFLTAYVYVAVIRLTMLKAMLAVRRQ